MQHYKLFKNDNEKSKKKFLVFAVDAAGKPITKKALYFETEREAGNMLERMVKDDLKQGRISKVLPGIGTIKKKEE